MQQGKGGKALSLTLALALTGAVLQPNLAQAQWAASNARHGAALAPAWQGDRYWRQQVRVASPSRYARWNSAPPGAVRVYHKRFDARWQWRSAPRHHVVYTYYRGDIWFLDPTTGWAYSIDRYGIVYTADPYRGWVYSLGPLTRWTADLLYFFDLYRFDRGYWYCSDYDYFVDLWEDYPRYGYYTYDTAYSTVWEWEPYFSSPTFITYTNRFTTVWVRQVRSHYDYIERNPYYRRELIDNIGLPAVQAAPPRTISPRAVATTAYWEARDLAAAGMRPPARGRDTGQGAPNPGFAPGSIVDARQAPAEVVGAGAPAPGFNAPFPDGSYGFGVQPGNGRGGPAAPAENAGLSGSGERGRDDGRGSPAESVQTLPEVDGRGGPQGDQWPPASDSGRGDKPPQFEEPAYVPPADSQAIPEIRDVQPDVRSEPAYEPPRNEIPTVDDQRGRDDARFEAPAEQRYEEPRYEAPREEPRYEAPQEQPRYEEPAREEPRYEAPREEPRYEAPAREEPRYEEPAREEPRYEEPEREEPRYEEPAHEEPRSESSDDDGGSRERQED